METSIPDKKIYFSGDTAEIISNILKKYSLEETDEDLAKKMFGENQGPFVIRGGVILRAAISLAQKETTEKDIVLLLKKELNISQTIAEGLTNEIKIQLVKIATTNKPITKNEDADIFPNIKPPISVAESTEINIPSSEVPEKEPRGKQARNRRPATVEETKKFTTQKIQSKGPDKYRESID